LFALCNWLLLLKDNKDGSSLYSRIIDIIKFACKFICMENSKWVQSFAKLTWPRISDMVITHFLSKVRFFLISFASSHSSLFSSMLGSWQLQYCHCEFWLASLSIMWYKAIISSIIFIKHLLLASARTYGFFQQV
jgi:cellulose synthase/poly-beta-1,6-N-acetylglucosamine synthase-like glycosyltransferase